MIKLVRQRLPSELESSLVRLTQELAGTPIAERIEHADRIWDRKTVRRDVYRPVKGELETMAPGLDCCMYCGNHMADTVDHFVPKSLCALRTFFWPNLFLACSTCNSRFKRDQHRSDGLVGSLLVDPTRDDPIEHLDLQLESGHYRAVEGSKKGQWTIDVCGLNEGRRPRAREGAWRSLGGDLKGWARARDEGRPDDMRFHLWRMRDQPFADVCYAALHKAVSDNADAIFVDTDPHVLALLRDEELRALLLL
ncbi:HNH endonuclease [Streptomyces microflavus]|uniref:HNH endonuclease n=1 Tax=Streptomyces microflavus TaxID=1919 RepID=UPI0033ED6FD4